MSVLAGLNTLPLYQAGYDTTQDYVLFWLDVLLGLCVSAGLTAALIFVLWAGGQYLGRLAWPRQDKVLPRGADRWANLARSGWRGLMLGGLSGGYAVLFYLAATQVFGGWTPLDTPVTDLFATPFPFLEPLRAGLLPAVEEELLYRLVGISMVLGLACLLGRGPGWGWRLLALVVPGASWAGAHLAYVREPFYLRGIELLIAAVLLEGLFFLRFDLTTVIVAHCAYNAGLTALPLLRSGEPYFVLCGLVVVAALLAPVIPGAVRSAWRRWRGQPGPAQPRIRPATADDRATLAALPVPGLDWGTLLDDPAATVLCLQADDTIVGAAVGRVNGEEAGEVLAVYVARPWRRRYWGSALVDALSARWQVRGVRSVQVTTTTGDRVGVAFWASQGWRPAVQVFARSLAPSPRRTWRDVTRWCQASLGANAKLARPR